MIPLYRFSVPLLRKRLIHAKNLTGSEAVNNIIKILYENQKGRGQEGFGFVGLNASSVDTYRALKESGIIGYLNENPYSEILFHHRNPTSTQNCLKSTHPFKVRVSGKTYYFAHNGIIQNCEELWAEHKKQGIAYESAEQGFFNDSEALAWDFCLWLNKGQEAMKAKGPVAFVCLETNGQNRAVKLYFYRNSEAPLRVYRDKALLVISSEGGYPLLKENRLYFWDYEKRQILKGGALNIACQNLYDYDFYMGEDDFEYEDVWHQELESLRREWDYLIGLGRYEDADYIQEQIADLEYQLKGRI